VVELGNPGGNRTRRLHLPIRPKLAIASGYRTSLTKDPSEKRMTAPFRSIVGDTTYDIYPERIQN